MKKVMLTDLYLLFSSVLCLPIDFTDLFNSGLFICLCCSLHIIDYWVSLLHPLSAFFFFSFHSVFCNVFVLVKDLER